jgi:hypothetical protein
LDSLSTGHPTDVFVKIRSFLEIKVGKKQGRLADMNKFHDFNVTVIYIGIVFFFPAMLNLSCQVPQQCNGSDCGFYALHFAKQFMADPEKYQKLIWV